MRIRRFDLTAFGHFTGLSMDFAPDSPDFHVVYGDNEAGKSTALMAIRYLLYGFPGQTP